MKNLFILLLVSFFSLQLGHAQIEIKAGKTEFKELKLKMFDGVQVARGIDVEINKSEENKAVISSNVMEYLKLTVEKGILKITYDIPSNKSLNNANTKIKLFAKNVKKITAKSAADIEVNDAFNNETISIMISSAGSVSGIFKGNHVNLNVASSGDFDGKINAKSVDIIASSSADVICKGSTEKLNIKANSSADVNTKDLKAKFVKVKASSSSDVEVFASHELNAKANSGADITYETTNEMKKLSVSSSSGGDNQEK